MRGTIRVMIDSATAASARRRLAGLLPTWALLIVGVVALSVILPILQLWDAK